MIDFEQILVIGVGSLVLVNFAAALLATLDWDRIRRDWKRTRKFYAVHWQRMSDTDRKFWTWWGRTLKVSVMVVLWVAL